MKTLAQRLASRAACCRAHDDDSVKDVYAAPGPRAQGDEATGEPPLSAELLDEIRVSGVPDEPALASLRLARDDEDPEGGGGGELN